jgi:hypothetical protein
MPGVGAPAGASDQAVVERGSSRFLGFERPFVGIYRVLLDDGRVTQSQTVTFSDVPGMVATPTSNPGSCCGPGEDG